MVVSAPDYLTPGGRGLVARDRHATLIPVTIAGNFDNATAHIARLDEIARGQQRPPFQVLVAGNAQTQRDFTQVAESDLRKAETRIGVGIALLVLLGVLCTLVASLLPLGLGAVAIAVAMGAVGLLGLAFHLTFTVTNMVSMMGLAVAIDYSLFIVSRYREERRSGLALPDAIQASGATASRAVLFSGMTVLVALLGLMIVPNSVFRSLAAGAILVVIVAVAAALTLLPALLALLGDRIEWGRVFRRGRRHRAGPGTAWSRLAEAVMRLPVASVAAGVTVLVLLGLSCSACASGRRASARCPQDPNPGRRSRCCPGYSSAGSPRPCRSWSPGR